MIAALSAALAVLFLLAAPRDAGAECAWVLWHQIGAIEAKVPRQIHLVPSSWQPVEGYETKMGCEDAAGRLVGRFVDILKFLDDERLSLQSSSLEPPKPYAKPQYIGWPQTRCLPATVDPRGPTGGAR